MIEVLVLRMLMMTERNHVHK